MTEDETELIHANAYESRGMLVDDQIVVGFYRAPDGDRPLGAVAYLLDAPLAEGEELSEGTQAISDGLFFGASKLAGLCGMESDPGHEGDEYSKIVDELIWTGPDRPCAVAARPRREFIDVYLFTNASTLGKSEEELVRAVFENSQDEWSAWRGLELKVWLRPLPVRGSP